MAFKKSVRREKIKSRIRGRVFGTSERPRLTVFRSNRQIYAQIIDDTKGVTIVSASSHADNIENASVAKIEKAALVGKLLAEKAAEKGISQVVFDRNGYLYHGRVKGLAEGAREGGLNF